MDMITISAKTLDEAITKALLELQTTSDHLHYEIVQKESGGFLGIFGSKPCVIRARVMEEKEEQEIKRKRAEKEKAEREAAEKEKRKKAEEERKAEAAKKTELERKTEIAKKAEVEKKNELDKKAPLKPSPSEKVSKRNYEQREFNNRRKHEKRDASRYEKREIDGKPEREVKVRQEVKMDEEVVQKKAKDFLEQVFRSMDIEVSIETKINAEEGELQIIMTGEGMGILIGKRGQTLDSLQYLVSLVVNKETEGYLRVKLDTENYRERRKETLEVLARNISYKVKRTKHPVALEPMNPYERRIIHSALQNDRYVVTRSEGEDPYRHVVISLKRENYGGRKDRYSRRDNRDRDNRNRDGQVANVADDVIEKNEAGED